MSCRRADRAADATNEGLTPWSNPSREWVRSGIASFPNVATERCISGARPAWWGGRPPTIEDEKKTLGEYPELLKETLEAAEDYLKELEEGGE